MNLPFFIARRLASSSSGNKPGVMERIAVVSVALSVAVMLLSLAVIVGFKREVVRNLTGLASHAVVTDIRGVSAPDSEPVRRTAALEELLRSVEGFASMAPYAARSGIVRTPDAVQGVLLKGVDTTYDWAFLGRCLRAGALPRVGDSLRTKDVLLSEMLARRLKLGVGDKVEMLFVEGSGMRPRRDRFRISGLYATGMDETDELLAFTDLRNVQRLADWQPDEVSGYELRTDDFAQSDDFARRVALRLLYDDGDEAQNLTVTSLRELYPAIFDWLAAHNVNAVVIVGIMLVVAFFNMASALLILVLERTRMIGLLKALGMRNGPLRRLFLYRAAFIALRGMAWGNGVGLLLCAVQQWFHVVKLDSEGYLLSEMPIALEWGWWLLLNAGVLAVIVLLLVLPTYIISSVKPEQTIRYE
ncbi:ABC transporter permease [uncultured Alistipes sp.]|uniref:ABC transporter permease n=1 Tax=uncultured Alistipes sp. TaxID=538949 RepID=UPI0026DF3273|nr:FtsX-like permease family protein [uncultured Alistipes sp.]